MITVDQLKDRSMWRHKMHADGKGFSINFFEAEINGIICSGWRRSGKDPEVGYAVGTEFACRTLQQLADYLNKDGTYS